MGRLRPTAEALRPRRTRHFQTIWNTERITVSACATRVRGMPQVSVGPVALEVGRRLSVTPTWCSGIGKYLHMTVR